VYVYNDLGDIYHDIYTTPEYIWEVRYGTTTVIRRSRTGAGDLSMNGLPAIHRDPSRQTGALTAAQGYVHVTPDGGGTMIHFTASSLAWSKSVPGVTAPVITATGRVVVGSTSGLGSYVRAYNLNDGSEAWSVALSSEVKDLAIGDMGNLYVLQATKLLALDASTGALRKTYINLPNSTEMILSQGKMHVVGPAELIGIHVESQGYDALAPWPVRFGDNQRTTNLPLSRVR
jgi:outer membrane protein assembly factor BamB